MGTEFATGHGDGEVGDAAGRVAAEQALSDLAATSPDFAAVFCSPRYDCKAVRDGVQSVTAEAELIGLTTEAQFSHDGIHTSIFSGTDGVTVALLASDEMRFFTGFGPNATMDPQASVDKAAADIPTDVEGYPHLTGLFFSSIGYGVEETLMRTYQTLPINWAGGGATDRSFENVTVFTGDEMGTDALALAVIASKRPTGLGVGSSHEPIGGSFEVTRSEDNVVYELDGEPAYEVWRRTFEETLQEEYGFSMDEIEDDPGRLYLALTEMVFGFKTGEDEFKLRTPSMTLLYESPDDQQSADTPEPTEGIPFENPPTLGTRAEGALYFADPVPEGTTLYPMASNPENKVGRGQPAVRTGVENLQDTPIAGGLIFDCPCGELVLQENYHELTDTFTELIDAPIAGVQSGGGEICLRPGEMRGWHGSASSVLLFPGGESG